MSVPVKHRCTKVSVKAYSSNTCTNFKMTTRCPELESETELQNDFDKSSESQRSTAKQQKNTTGVGGGGGGGGTKKVKNHSNK